MDFRDSILIAMYCQVGSLEKPEDTPTEATRISNTVGVELNQLLSACLPLSEEAFLKISTLCDPPLLYLTPTGIARAKRLILATA